MAVLGASVVFGSTMVSGNGDTARHLAVGEYMLSSGSLLREDVFSYTLAGAPFVPKEWLAEILIAASYRLAGLAGIVVLHGTVIGLSFAILLRLLLARGHGALLASAITALALGVSAFHWLARPHVFTFLGTAIFVAILDGWYSGRVSRRWLWALPAVMVVWVNLHSGFLIGLLLVWIYLGSDGFKLAATNQSAGSPVAARFRALVAVGAATAAITLVNPGGLVLLDHIASFFQKSLIIDRTAEWMSPDFHRAEFRWFLGMLVATLVAAAWSRRRLELHEGLLLGGFAGFALYANRNAPLFAILVAQSLAALLSDLSVPTGGLPGADRLRRYFARRNAALTHFNARLRAHLWPLAGVIGLLVVGTIQLRGGSAPLSVAFDRVLQPVDAVAYLRTQQPLGRGFNNIEWGGYLLHELWPTDRVFIDGQTDFYGEELTREYIRVASLGDGWLETLARYDARWVLYRTDAPLTRALAGTPGWRVSYQDPTATVLMRET